MSYIQSNQQDLLSIVKYPILTEKTIRLIEQNQYSFAVDRKADKTAIKSSVEQLFDVKVISVPGKLTDHYNPMDRTVNLSPDVYQGRHVAAAAVAAHECGHAVQHARAYTWLQMRSQMVPIVNFSNSMMGTVFIIGIFGGSFLGLGWENMLKIFILLQAVVTAFTLVTLPVEFDASSRALVWLKSSGITGDRELTYASDALKWAASTYVVAALAAVTYLLYYVAMLRD